MPERLDAATALMSVGEGDLKKIARAAHLLDIESPAFGTGQCPHRTRAGQGTEFLDFRNYHPGEDTRHLDWRVSARLGRPQVRTYRDELSADWQLCLDRSTSMGTPDGNKWMLAVQLAAAFTYMLLHTGNRVGLVQFSNRVDDICPLGRGRLQYVRIAEQLGNSDSQGQGGGSNLSSTTTALRPGTHLVIISDFLVPDAMKSDIERLRSPGRKIHAIQILSPSETDLNDPGTRSVRDVESGRRVTVNSGVGRAALSRLHRWQVDLQSFSAKNGIRLSSCSAVDQWQDVMLRHIAVITNA